MKTMWVSLFQLQIAGVGMRSFMRTTGADGVYEPVVGKQADEQVLDVNKGG